MVSIKRWRARVVLWAMLCGLPLLLGCTHWFFYPQNVMVQTPDDRGYDYRDVFLQTADGERVHAWMIEPQLNDSESVQGVVYFLHGNAQNISWHILGAEWLLNAGYRVFALDYRGYGRSSGKPDVPEVFHDIDAGFDWLEREVSAEMPMYLFGQSLGASLGLLWMEENTAAQSRMTRVVLDSGFSHFGTIAKQAASNHWITWAFQYPAKWVLSAHKDPTDAIRSLHLPILLLHSIDDSVVPYTHSDALLSAGGTKVKRLTGSGPHISVLIDDEIRRDTLMWLRSGSIN